MKLSIRFRCHDCNARIKAPEQLLGQFRACPGCGKNVLVRIPKPEDSDPLLVPGNWVVKSA